jgi:tellurium resistance protein TerD
LSFAVTIHDADARRQNFGMISNAFIRVLNEAGGTEIARYDLSEDASTETAMIFGDLYRHNGEWKFKAIGQGFAGGLGPLASSFGVNV